MCPVPFMAMQKKLAQWVSDLLPLLLKQGMKSNVIIIQGAICLDPVCFQEFEFGIGRMYDWNNYKGHSIHDSISDLCIMVAMELIAHMWLSVLIPLLMSKIIPHFFFLDVLMINPRERKEVYSSVYKCVCGEGSGGANEE